MAKTGAQMAGSERLLFGGAPGVLSPEGPPKPRLRSAPPPVGTKRILEMNGEDRADAEEEANPETGP